MKELAGFTPGFETMREREELKEARRDLERRRGSLEIALEGNRGKTGLEKAQAKIMTEELEAVKEKIREMDGGRHG